MVALEEEANRSRNHTTIKRAHTYLPFVISCPSLFDGVIHSPLRVAHIFWWDEPCVVARPRSLETGYSIPIGSFQRLRYYEPFASFGRNVGKSVHLIFIDSTRRSYLHPQIQIETQVGRRIIPVSLPQSAIVCLLKIKKEIIKFNSRK
jgi:hypothetical protein